MDNKGLLFVMTIFTYLVQIQCFSQDHQSIQTNLKNLVSFNRVSRQAPSDVDCRVNVRITAECTTSYGQSFINQISQCGTLGQDRAIEFEQGCRINAAGVRCGEVNISNVEASCRSSPTACPTECRNNVSLSQLQNGCCNSNFPELEEYLRSCSENGVGQLPSPCPPLSLNIPTSLSSNPSCSTEEDLNNMVSQIQCSPEYASVLESLSSNNCQALARENEIMCSMQDEGFCINRPINTAFEILTSATQNCPSTSECSPSCQAAINTINNNLGCCFNIFNATYVAGTAFSGLSFGFDNISDNGLWQQCGITPPGFCGSSPSPIPNPTPIPIATPVPTDTSIPSTSPSPNLIPGPNPTPSPNPSSAAGYTAISVVALIFLVISNIYFV